ncbi:hypothetical protein [Afifella sp. IM 167]|uniref:hypothetical protein n=1 Tax=Afifella sp. IM 167 TaxID=2033586 RepID=UPI001CC9B505|nr:hypothetical protein [Afifella sp. IM 167]MBZ8133254.1 hypothetical protein [Afifella sp. IM 167]
MDVREIIEKGSGRIVLYMCGKCGRLYVPKFNSVAGDPSHAHERRNAEECCRPRQCECGVELDAGWTACPRCRLRKQLRKAKVISAEDYTGPVNAAGHGEWGEGYSSNIAAMLQACHDYDDPVPAFCHPCTARRLHLDVDYILEAATDEMHEGAEDQIVGADDLVAFIREWNARQTVVSYFEDRRRVIVLDEKRFSALIADDDSSETGEQPSSENGGA